MMSDHGAVELNNQNLSDIVSVSVVNVIAIILWYNTFYSTMHK